MAIMGKRTWTTLVGPLGRGASTVVVVAAASAATVILTSTSRRVGAARGAAMGAVAFDLCGGLVAFQLRPTRKKYSESSLQSRMMFALAHVQPFLLPIIGEGSWRRATARYAAAIIATAALERFVPHSTNRRVVANCVAATVSIADLASDKSQQRWLGPVYLMKVIGGHSSISTQHDATLTATVESSGTSA